MSVNPKELAGFEKFAEESTKRCLKVGYSPSTFLAMRQRYGLVEAARRLVESSEIQSGFARMKRLNMLEWTLEAGVLKFPNLFSEKTQEFAGFRLGQAKGRKLRGKFT